LTSLENPSFSNGKLHWVDAEQEQSGAMRGLGLRMGFLTPPTSGRAPAVDALPVF
jgi:hypothetical protein